MDATTIKIIALILMVFDHIHQIFLLYFLSLTYCSTIFNSNLATVTLKGSVFVMLA